MSDTLYSRHPYKCGARRSAEGLAVLGPGVERADARQDQDAQVPRAEAVDLEVHGERASYYI